MVHWLFERQVIPVLGAGEALMSDLGDAIEHDPEVRQARRIADAARSRLVACMTDSQDVIDLAEAQRMLDAFRNALTHAEEAEDQVLVHRGLLTPAEAVRRAARRRPVTARADRPARAAQSAAGERRVRRPSVGRVVAVVLAVAAVAAVGVAVARLLGVRPPLARW
jgi:biotin carboxyl carrier protein